MKLERIGEAFDFYRHTPGSIEYCAKMMRPLLEKRNNAEALVRLEAVEDKCDKARKLKYDWDQKKKAEPLRRRGARELDDKIDRTLGNLARAPEPYAEMEANSPIKQAAKEFIDDLFPAGVHPITTQRFEDQHASVNELIERLRGDFSRHVAKLGLEPLVDELEELNERYGQALAGDEDGVEYSDVRAARTEAEDAFHRLIIKVMHDYMDDMEALNELLKPFFRQEERLRRHYQRGGSAPEFDPDTGEPIGEEGIVDTDEAADEPVVDPV